MTVGGEWMSVQRCRNSAVAVGFQLRSEGKQRGDDTAANNLKLICSDNSVLTGDGMAWGDWTEQRLCDTGHALCGIQAQIEPPQRQRYIFILVLR